MEWICDSCLSGHDMDDSRFVSPSGYLKLAECRVGNSWTSAGWKTVGESV